MSKSVANSGSNSGGTSGKPPGRATDGDYLGRQAADAQAAVKRALEDLKASLSRGVDVRVWAKEHPLGMAVLATAAGFAIASAAVPSKRRQELKRWVAMERAAAAANGHGQGVETGERGGGASFLGSLGREVLAIVRPAVIGMVTSAVAAYQEKANEVEPEEAEGAGDSSVP